MYLNSLLTSHNCDFISCNYYFISCHSDIISCRSVLYLIILTFFSGFFIHHHHLHISTHRHVEQRLLSDVTPSSAPSENSRQLIDLFVKAFMNISTICTYIYSRIRIFFMLDNVNPSYETIISVYIVTFFMISPHSFSEVHRAVRT